MRRRPSNLLAMVAAMVGAGSTPTVAQEMETAQRVLKQQYGGVKQFGINHQRRYRPSYYRWKRQRRAGR